MSIVCPNGVYEYCMRGPLEFYSTGRRWNKTCTFPAEGLDYCEDILGPFRTMLGVPHPLKVGGLRPPTFPGTYTLAPGNYFLCF